MVLSIEVIESVLQTRLPERHRAALLDPYDPVHDCIELLGADEGNRNNIVATNKDLRSTGWKEWPEHLIAFATRGCGDFFAYDLRVKPYRVYCVGPIGTAAEEAAACEDEGFVFASFDDWYAYVVGQHDSAP